MEYLPWNQPASRLESVCVRDARRTLTYREMGDAVDAVAEQLAEMGVGPGDVVAVMLPNRVELLVVLLAAWRLRAAATPVNPSFTATEADYQVGNADASVVVGESASTPTAGRPLLTVDELRTRALGTLPAPTTTAQDIALIVYTSGSTGRPKGVLLDHARLQFMASTMGEHTRIGAVEGVVERCLLVLPLFHVNAICVSWLATALAGGELILLQRFEPRGFLDAIEQYRPTYFSAVPTIYARLAELPDDVVPDTSSLRFAICGAAPVSRELLTAIEQRFGIALVEGYGLTEGTCASTCNPVDGERRIGTVGPALPGQRIAIARPDGTHLPTGETGEILVAGPNVMIGYLGLPEVTAETVVDGWLHTGDVGRLDQDGYLTIVDRIKDMIIRGGENIYPKEIENVLHSFPGVLEAAVVGRPDERYGEVPVAYVVAQPGSLVTSEALLEHCRIQLTRVKLPVAISVLPQLPRNGVGKIDKLSLRRSTPN